jgi:hypothetical protein
MCLNGKASKKYEVGLVVLWRLMPLSTIFQLYRGGLQLKVETLLK